MAFEFTRTYAPSAVARITVSAVILPGVFLFGWAGIKILSQGVWEGLIFVVMAALLAVWVVFITTTQVKLSRQELVRTWWFGSEIIPVSEVSRLSWSRGRGQLNLVVRAARKWVMLSSLSLRESELREIARDILAARGLEEHSSWPPYASCVDVEEMARRRLTTNDVSKNM